ncbi:MAG: diguanylate cyclase, partial [Corallincola sp.]|nr:diguanylate cyclase [Corallincola sp.]
DQPLGISASIGWCEIHSRDPQQLINNADRACYTAKARGRNTCVDFHSLNDRG